MRICMCVGELVCVHMNESEYVVVCTVIQCVVMIVFAVLRCVMIVFALE